MPKNLYIEGYHSTLFSAIAYTLRMNCHRFLIYYLTILLILFGYIIEVNKSAPSLKVEFDDGKIATYKQENLDEITLAYAISIHKSQGSEFPAVIIMVSGGNPFLMTRNLLYTAITRAKQIVVIEGSKESLAKMVKNDYTAKRNTLLTQFLKENCKRAGVEN